MHLASNVRPLTTNSSPIPIKLKKLEVLVISNNHERGESLNTRDACNAILGSGLSRGYVLGSELLLLLITTNWMTPDGRGIYIAGFAFLKTISIICSLSFGQIAIYHLSERRHDAIGEVGATLIVSSILFPAISLLCIFFYGSISDEFQETYVNPFLLILAVGLPIFVLEIYLYAFLTALGRLNSGNKAIVIGRTVAWISVLSLGFIHSHLTPKAVLASLIFGQTTTLLGYAITLIAAFREMSIRLKINWKLFIEMLRKSIRLHPSIIGSVVFGGIDILIAFELSGAKAASEYQIAIQLLAALSIIPFSIAQFGYKLVSEFGVNKAWLRFKSVLHKTLAAHCVISLFSVGVVWFSSQILFNKTYINVGMLYALLSIGSPGLFLSLVMAPFWIGSGYFSTTSLLTIATGAVIIPLSYSLTLTYGTIGTTIAFIISQFLSILINKLFIIHLNKKCHA